MPKKRSLQMCISYGAFPGKGENTSVRNWGKVGKVDIDERVIITETPNRSQVNVAHTMIDLMEEKILNTRFTKEELAANNILVYFLGKYKASIAEARELYRAKYKITDDPKAVSDAKLINVRRAVVEKAEVTAEETEATV